MTAEKSDQRIERLEKETEREASLNLRKFVKLLQLRLVSQGLKPTLLWMHNLFNRVFFDRPVRGQTEILPNLFVGPQFKQRGWKSLEKWGIDSVVNMRREFDDRSLGIEIPNYHHIPLVDDTAPSVEELESGVKFITENIDRGGKVYIHCGAGVGRAPTMASAYLISKGMTPKEAEETIRAKRSFIRMVRLQRDVLAAYAAKLTGSQAK